MAQVIITPQVITREALRLLENMFVMAGTVSRAHEDDFKYIGEDLYVRKPNRFTSTEGKTASAQEIQEAWQKVTVRTQRNISWKFSMRELTLSVERYSERYIEPAISEMVHQIEMSLHQLYKKAYHTSVPAAGITAYPSTFIDLGQQNVLLTDHAVPKENRTSLLSTDACINLANQVAGFASAYSVDRKAETAMEEARIGKFNSFSTMESQFVTRHQTGALGGSPVVNMTLEVDTIDYTTVASNPDAALSWTQTLTVDAAATGITNWAREGDTFTIADCYSVNPATRASTGKLQTFVVRQDANSDGGGNVSLKISPPIIGEGQYQTVAFAAGVTDLDNKALTFTAGGNKSVQQNISYHKEAITFGMVPMEMPDSAVWGTTMTDNGYSVRVYKWLDGTNDDEYIRLDAMWFCEVVQPDMIARLQCGQQ